MATLDIAATINRLMLLVIFPLPMKMVNCSTVSVRKSGLDLMNTDKESTCR
jgi:hypothetical protein